MRRNNGGLPRELRSELIYAAAAANAWLRGLSLPEVALHYRYEPLTALNLIARCAINTESKTWKRGCRIMC